ncbi:MAG: hypothetical protein IPK83_21440 [Planctomycetes bacterium]|nr:hypothetical protein [Planctomycetota bacterium]
MREIIRNGLDHDEGDFLLVRLNRPVQRTAPVRIRRSGQADPGDRVVCIGHPDQLATKIDLAGVFDEQTTGSGLPLTYFRNVHLLAGSSGSMFYNIDKQYVESVAVSGVCLLQRQDVPENCWYYDYSCEQIRGVGYAIKSFAYNVPPYHELIVGPLDRVKHIGPAGGPITNAVTQFTISVPTQNAGPMEFSVVDPDANLQTLVPVPSISFTIQLPVERKKKVLYPGESAVVTVTCAAGAALPGYHHRRLVVSNGTNSYSDTIWHDFELGLTEFSVKPTQNFHVNAAFPPFTQTMDYFVSNTRPDPVTVRVSRDQPWIRMLPDGPYLGPPFGPETLDFILTPVGTEGDTRVVTVGFNGLADCLPLGQNIAHLDFTNISGTGGGDLALGDTMRRVTLNLTRAEFAHGDAVVIPDGDPFGAVAMINVPAGFTPTDFNVGIGLSRRGHFEEIDPSQLKITVTSPLGESITLWDHESLEYFYSFDDEGVDGQPAPTGQLLSIFDGDNPEGLWTVHVIDDVPGTEHQMSRIILSFDFEREGCE